MAVSDLTSSNFPQAMKTWNSKTIANEKFPCSRPIANEHSPWCTSPLRHIVECYEYDDIRHQYDDDHHQYDDDDAIYVSQILQ